jgi:hypothetical protein
MADVRTLCKEYPLKDIYNMDETGLNWRRSPDRTLATKAMSGTKKSKDRITVALTSNADGSERLEPWVIGKSKNPRALKQISRQHLRITYRYNKTKWMTGIICEEYLQWLNRKMRAQGRRILLLMDNFSGHELAVQLVGGLEGLSNVRVAWLPPNTTSKWQPMDQGIIASWKLQYRKKWIAFMLREYEAGRDPLKTCNILKAIQWTRYAWETAVRPATIQRCWVKSTLVDLDVSEVEGEGEAMDRVEIQQQIEQLPFTECIQLDDFLGPQDEDISDEETDIFTSVVEHHSITQESEEEEEEVEEVRVVSHGEALDALNTLRIWKLQSSNIDETKALDRMEQEIVTSTRSTARQTMISEFFS